MKYLTVSPPRPVSATKNVTHNAFFTGHFPTKAAAKTAVRWIPRGDWGCSADPSGRSVSIHNAAYVENGKDE